MLLPCVFSVVFSDRSGSKRYKLKHRKFYLNIRKHVFTERVVGYWNSLPREVAKFLSLATFKAQLYMALRNLL